jgi:hypothetical protein
MFSTVMYYSGSEDDPTCTRLLRSQMVDKLVTKDGEVVATGIVRACKPTNCVDSTQLGADDVGIFIFQLNGHASLPDDWRFSV